MWNRNEQDGTEGIASLLYLGSFAPALFFSPPCLFQEYPPCHIFPAQYLFFQVLHLVLHQWSLCAPKTEAI